MTGEEFKAIRVHIGMTWAEFGAELGLAGSLRNNSTRVAEYERNKKPIPAYLARLAFMLKEHFDAEDHHLPDWPDSCKVTQDNPSK